MFPPVETGLLLNAAFTAHAEGRTREAISLLTRALRRAQADDDQALGALIMTSLGTMLLDVDEYEQAVTALAAALPVQRELGERAGEQRALLGLCGALSSLYQHTEALDHGRRGVALGQELADVTGIAAAHNQLGNAARRAGLTIEAHENYQAAAALYREHGRTVELADALNNIGGLQYSLGRPQEAAEALEEALPLHRAANDIGGQVSAENTMGWVLRDLGQPEEALVRLRVADRLARDSGDLHLTGATAQRVGGVYLALGRIEDAIEDYREADRIARTLAQPWAMGAAANSLARALLIAGDATGAAEQMERAVEIATRIAVPAAQATAQVGLGIARLRAGDTDGAAAAVEHAMRISVDIDDRHTQAVAVGVGGQIAAAIGRFEQAADLLSEAATRFERLGSDLGVATVLADLAEAYRSLGRVDDAVTAFERAMTLAESMRARIADDDMRASFFSSVVDVSSRYCELLVSVDRVADALRIVERARARVLAERLARLRVTAHGDVDAAVARRAEIHGELLAVEQQLEAILRTPNADDAELAATRDRRRSLELRLRTSTVELRSASPRLAEFVAPRAPDLTTLRREIIGESVLLEYVLGEQESFLIAATADREQAFPLPPRPEIELMVTELRAAVLSRRRTYPHGETLFHHLVAPAADLIGGRDVIVVPDGVLHDLPFSLLLTEPVPDTAWSYRTLPYLIRERAVSVLPSATVAGLITHRTDEGTAFHRELVAFGDPVAPGADRLVHSAREVWDIAGTISPALSDAGGRERYDDDAILVRTGVAATRTELEQLAAGPDGLSCRFLHLATHGLLDAVRPEFSGLLFSGPPDAAETDTILRSYEIMSMRINSTLVVLSACETGLGRTLGGEGVLGLSRSFFYAGASALVVSLWRVIDASTVRLMTPFYRHLLNAAPAAALRDAQLAMIDSRSTHPYQWAAFVFVGPSPATHSRH
jgi:CHAT domain-containing protein/tetratricopeptide (TPR) repeat protein